MRQHRLLYHLSVASVLGLISACAGRHIANLPQLAPGDSCSVTSPTVDIPDTIAVAVSGPVRAVHAPLASNDSERLIFRQLYENLVAVDCRGRVKAVIAESWESADGGRVWTLTIRDDAHFWDGSRVTAADIRSSWLSPRTAGAPIRAVTIVSDRRITITFEGRHQTIPTLLAHPAFAVVKADPASSWPLGTGNFVRPERAEASDDLMVVHPAAGHRSRPVLEFIRVSGTDLRDLLDRDLDVLVTMDPPVIEYAERDERFTTAPLPWDRTYVLLSRLAGDDPALARDVASRRTDLATRAVRSEARGATGWFGTAGLDRCEFDSGASAPETEPASPSALSSRIVFPRRDPVARSLAERLVARGDLGITDLDRRSRLTASGLSEAQFAAALEQGREFAYVVAWPRQSLMPCSDVEAVVASAPWLSSRAAIQTMTIPLVDTRPRLIVRNGIGHIDAEWDGSLVLYDEPRGAASRRSSN